MNSAVAATAHPFADAAAGAAALCFHCGEALPAAPVAAPIGGANGAFCCAGCAAAATWIHQASLDDYYQLRTSHAGRVAADAPDLAIWDREDVLATHARNVPRGREIVLATDGMRCAACAWLIDRALSREPGVVEISANAVTGRIRLVWDPVRNRLSSILSRLQALGYRPWLAGTPEVERARQRERRGALLRLGLAGIAALQAMMFAEALYLDTAHQMPDPTRDFFRWLTFLLATPVVFYAGFPFLAGAWRELSGRRAGMDVLVAMSILLAWGASTFETIRRGPYVWFDAAVMFVFLLLGARLLEQRARRLASARVDALARARPVLAQRETAAGVIETVPAAQLQKGDVVRVAAGEHIPADALLLDPATELDESLLTGESHPVLRVAGDPVLAGSVCSHQSLRLQVIATGAATRLSALAQLVQKAHEHRPQIARQADHVASWFVLALATLTLLVYLYWHAVDPARAFSIALAMLVISCPCALSLAVPAALAAAYSRLSEIGVLVLRPDALQKLAAADTAVFDKTGTLGDGGWQITDITPFGDCSSERALALSAALEADSLHPLASAFRNWRGQASAIHITRHAGLGLEGTVDDRSLRLGTGPFAAGRDDDGAVWLGTGAAALARFELREQPRTESRQTLERLQQMGLALQLLSGDANVAVRRFVARLGFDFEHAAGRMLPDAKLASVRALQAQHRRVVMVGDGINDAPVLAGADVSIAVSNGAALARQSADLVLLNPSLLRVADSIAIARRTRRIIRQNLVWAIAYNLLALPIAASGNIPPWAAALAMAVSSITVTLNALRLLRAPAA
jgi:P-type Cu2+ transporter